MKKTWLILLIALLACVSQATTVEYELTCAERYIKGTVWEHNVNLGKQFSEIAQVSIIWSGMFNAALVINPSTPEDDWLDVGLCLSLGNATSNCIYIYGGDTYAPDSESLSGQAIFASSGYDNFFDGKETVRISHLNLVSLYNYVSTGFVDLNNATLIVEGTLVPEPVSLSLLLIGSTVVLRRQIFF